MPGRNRRSLRYAIIGAGMAGLLAAIRLRERGDEDFVIFEKNPDVGGTWYENRYPGLACDVPAHVYTYSFAPNPDWSSSFAPGPEIHAYFRRMAETHGLRGKTRFSCEVRACDFIDGRWRITYDGGFEDADVVIAATGVLHHPHIPDIPGLADFAGPCFHSARWPEDLDYRGRRVGVIGGGSTSVQIVSALVGSAAHVVQFCRTPQWVLSTPALAYSEEDRAAFVRDPARMEAIRNDPEYLAFTHLFTTAIIDAQSPEMAQIEAIARDSLEQGVADPRLRARLTPDYRAACKRLVMSGTYYDKIQDPGATFENGRIDQIDAGGVTMADGTRHAIDILVLATGFETDRFVRPMRVTGTDGRSLDAVWGRRPTAYLAVAMPGFPNFFFLNGPTGPVGNFSLIDIAERQWTYVDQLIDLLRDGRAASVEPTQTALTHYDEARMEAARGTIWASGCSSWYLDADGVPASWPWSYQRFVEEMAAPRLADFALC
ncbi:MAG: flavin-containing monooxygenase [Sphingobium sp.]